MTDDISSTSARALDAAVAEEAMGWAIHHRNTAWYVPVEKQNAVDVPPSFLVSEWHPSYHWGQASEVMQTMQLAGWRVKVQTEDGPGHRWRCTIYSSVQPNWEVSAVCDEAPRAICEASLKAVRAKGQDDE